MYHSAMKMKEILPSATIQMNLEGILLGNKSYKERHVYCLISLICGIGKNKFSEKENEICRCQWWGVGGGGGSEERWSENTNLQL